MRLRVTQFSTTLISIIMVFSLLLTGCTTTPLPDTPTLRPTYPIEVEVSFPNGAPPLNKSAELVCVVITRNIAASNISLEVILPESLELVSGNLSWYGSLPEVCTSKVINATVKSIKSGNWKIDVKGFIDQEKHNGYGGNLWYPLYVHISDTTAEWRINPPYGIPPAGGTISPEESRPFPPATVTATPINVMPQSSIEVEVSFPNGAPSLNQTAKLTCIIKSIRTIETLMKLNVILPDGFKLVNGNNSWQGTIPSKSEVKAIDIDIQAISVGNWTIDVPFHYDTAPGTGDKGDGIKSIYISVFETSAKWGKVPPWIGPPGTISPIKIQ